MNQIEVYDRVVTLQERVNEAFCLMEELRHETPSKKANLVQQKLKSAKDQLEVFRGRMLRECIICPNCREKG